jgi:3-hydroxyisobutyrate dehydrogenase-like beta-hydroxyacid dehydrogenase
MSKISVIGLGSMGSTLARTLLSAGHTVTVWNRSPEKEQQLVADGARAARTITDAVQASPVILVCVNNYTTTRGFFAEDEVLPILDGRTVVQTSSGTPQEAIAHESWFAQHGAGYLDAAILGSPKIIGTETGQILIAGNDERWHECKPALQCLAGNLQYTGAGINAAKVLDLAWLSQRLGYFMGLFQGLILCEASGVGLDVFSETVVADQRGGMIADTIHSNNFTDPVNTVKVWYEAIQHIQDQARETGSNSEILEFIADKFQRASSAGYADEDLAALVKIFR